MSKKKGKNSNYKNSSTVNTTAEDKKKNRIITVVCLSIVGALVLGALGFSLFASGNGKTEKMGTGACAYLETRDVSGREISYVEFTIQDHGKFVVLVDATTAPQTAANFLGLVRDGFYDGLTIFRAQDKFVIQGGKDESVKLWPIAGEFSSNGHANDISHIRGVISMARTNDPNSATSQFFITLHDDAKRSLDGEYAAFGYVVQGMSVVDEVAKTLINSPSSGYMGFVGDEDAITIVKAKILEGYTPD